MNILRYRRGCGVGFLLLSQAAVAADLEQVQAFINQTVIYLLVLVGLLFILYVYFMRMRDDRSAPLLKVLQSRRTVYSVAPEALVTDCVRMMARNKIGSVVVLLGESLVGIFTERDALNKVLAVGLDPNRTQVSEVMTRNPYYVSPDATVGEAMELVTQRRFRHLPIVEDGKVLAVVSSGDLTHWLVKDQVEQVQEFVDLAAR